MTTDTTDQAALGPAAMARMAENLKKVEALTERLSHVMANRQTHQKALDAPNQELFTKAS